MMMRMMVVVMGTAVKFTERLLHAYSWARYFVLFHLTHKFTPNYSLNLLKGETESWRD